MSIFFKKRLPAAVATPAAGQAALYVDSTVSATPLLAMKDETGTIYTLSRGLASLSAATAAISNTEVVILNATIPANYINIGTTYRITASGVGTTSTSPGNSTFRIRFGPTTLTGNIPTSLVVAATASRTAMPWRFDALVSVRTITASGTVIGECAVWSSPSTSDLFPLSSVSTTVATVVVDTTVQNLLELTYVSGASTSSIVAHVAAIEVAKA